MTQFDDLGRWIGEAATVLRANATASGLDAPVPSCPGWDVRDLVVHTGMVHRWAADSVRTGTIADGACAHEGAGRQATDLLDWFDDGAAALLQTLVDADPDAERRFFLRGSPTPLWGWTRRQAHETTIHAVDAMTARLGQAPRADQVWFGAELARDGLDELLTGFVPRRSCRLRSTAPLSLVVAAQGGPAWRVALSQDPPVVTAIDAADATVAAEDGADAVLTAAPIDLYLSLWNRAATLEARGLTRRGAEMDLARMWRELVHIVW